MLNDWNKVSVIEGRWTPTSKCDVKSCKSIAKFMVFNDDGESKMSRLFFCCCPKHLALAVRKAWIDNRENKQRLDYNIKKEEKEKAKKLLGIN